MPARTAPKGAACSVRQSCLSRQAIVSARRAFPRPATQPLPDLLLPGCTVEATCGSDQTTVHSA
eukprot:4012139-Amphidinium_carterae.1